MHHSTQSQVPIESPPPELLRVPEMYLYSRYEHGNLPVRVHRNTLGETLYDVTYPSDSPHGQRVVTYTSARRMITAFYGHDVHMPFDRYFRIGRYRKEGRLTGQANLLSLLDERQGGTRKTPITVDALGRVSTPYKTEISFDRDEKGSSNNPDDEVLEFIRAMEGDLLPFDEFIEPTEELREAFDRSFELELDRVEGLVGIELGAKSARKDSAFKADEVRRLLWKGFAGKMLSQGYDPEDVLQEVYRGLLVRNNGRCPWDARKSTFGHYVFLVISCVLTNYHRKQVRRIDKDAIPVEVNREGEQMMDIGQYGSCDIEYGSEVGDMLVLDELAKYLATVPDGSPEAVLGRSILPLVVSGHQRGEIVKETGSKPSLVSRALAWLRRQTALWATECGFGKNVPVQYLIPAV